MSHAGATPVSGPADNQYAHLKRVLISKQCVAYRMRRVDGSFMTFGDAMRALQYDAVPTEDNFADAIMKQRETMRLTRDDMAAMSSEGTHYSLAAARQGLDSYRVAFSPATSRVAFSLGGDALPATSRVAFSPVTQDTATGGITLAAAMINIAVLVSPWPVVAVTMSGVTPATFETATFEFAIVADVTPDAWLHRAKTEYSMFASAIARLNLDDCTKSEADPTVYVGERDCHVASRAGTRVVGATTVVVPSPRHAERYSSYAHLKRFARYAPPSQVADFWARVGREVTRRVVNCGMATWASTDTRPGAEWTGMRLDPVLTFDGFKVRGCTH